MHINDHRLHHRFTDVCYHIFPDNTVKVTYCSCECKISVKTAASSDMKSSLRQNHNWIKKKQKLKNVPFSSCIWWKTWSVWSPAAAADV